MTSRDHGGNLDAAIARFGGARGDWLDLSTGINPSAYSVPDLPADAWTALPDRAAFDRLITAARAFWNVPDEAEIIAAHGASALIARLPALTDPTDVYIPGPTYNEHAASFAAHKFRVSPNRTDAPAHVYVHPNNPDGRTWPSNAITARKLTIIDESFCDTAPDISHVNRTREKGVVVLKSFGKFWGLAGLRLGFAIGHPETLQPAGRPGLSQLLGPWSVPGAALHIGAKALADSPWANATRATLAVEAQKLDNLMTAHGAELVGGTTLFRTYRVDNAATMQDKLARGKVWSRIFPYDNHWIRLGLPNPTRWPQLEAALA